MGVGCLDDFGAASALLHLGATLPESGEFPGSEASASVSGDIFLGAQWHVAIRPGVLIVGTSADSTVRSFKPLIGDALTEQQAEGRIVGEQSEDGFGHRVVVIDGPDGERDLLISDPKKSLTADTSHNGAVYRFQGIGDGWTTRLQAKDAVMRMSGESPGGRLGSALVVCPDIDGDGLSEWMASATRDNTTASMAGQVVLALSADMAVQSDQLGIDALDTRWTGLDIGEAAGSSLSCRHDLNGDGTPDVLIGAPYADRPTIEDDETPQDAAGKVYLIYDSGPGTPDTLSAAADLTFGVGDANSWFGWSIATGDIDGDGLNDLAIGAPGAESTVGAVHIWSGAQIQGGDIAAPTHTLLGVESGGRFGWSTHIADINGDGIGDLLIGAPYVNPTGTGATYDAGRVSIYFGSAVAIEDWTETQLATDAPLMFTEPKQYLRTGQRIFSGDFDGDAAMDLVFLHRIQAN